jgi:hypothetical protein
MIPDTQLVPMEVDEDVSNSAEDDDWISSRQSASNWVVQHFNAETRNTYRKFYQTIGLNRMISYKDKVQIKEAVFRKKN